MPSSTSSSEPVTRRRRFPLAFVLAIGMVAAVEIALRQVEPGRLITYEGGLPNRYAVRYHLDAFGPADICFIGSSRSLAGFVCPEVKEICEERAGIPVTVANYASGGATAQELLPLVRYMLRKGRPKLVVMGMEPDQIQRAELVNERAAVFWSLPDWWEVRKRYGSVANHYLPVVIRNEIAEWYVTFRYRARPVNYLKELLRGGPQRTAVKGELAEEDHIVLRNKTLVVSPRNIQAIKQHFADDLVGPDGSSIFNEEKVRMIAEMNRLCKEAGVQLILVEVPNSSVFKSNHPGDLYPRFYARMAQFVAADGVKFVTLEQLGLSFDNTEFRDPVHLNFAGAERYTRAVTERVIIPALAAMHAQ